MSTTTSDSDVVFTFGEIIYRNTVPHAVGFVLYGVYLVVFSAYIWTAVHHPTHSRAARILLIAMLLLFLSATTQFITDITFSLEQIEGYLMWTSIPLADRRSLWLDAHEGIYVVERWPTAANFMISDLIVVWRAAVMYPQRRWARVAMWTVAFADLVLWICAASFTSRDAAQRSQNPTTDELVNTIGNFISLGTNLLGTGAIALKARNQKKLMSQASMKPWRGDVARILLLLVETGAFWAVVQLVFSVLQKIDTGGYTSLDLGVAVIAKIATYLAAILPTATVIIVRSQRSVENTLNLGNSSDFAFTPAGMPDLNNVNLGPRRLSEIRFADSGTPEIERKKETSTGVAFA